MSAISKVLRQAGDGADNGYKMLLLWCPGCNEDHGVVVARPAGQPGDVWGYNDNPVKPTFTPSLLVWWSQMSEAGQERIRVFKEQHGRLPTNEEVPYDDHRRCHSFITDGRIQFLDDCTHALRGQTVDLPEKWEPGQ